MRPDGVVAWAAAQDDDVHKRLDAATRRRASTRRARSTPARPGPARPDAVHRPGDRGPVGSSDRARWLQGQNGLPRASCGRRAPDTDAPSLPWLPTDPW
ncbi:hypothetical protein [Streptomyces sp. NPDC059176]|uniref:hypothetical protein n=1 Tax=unclassified Streptomyces TaxID=2593676 RepID=UPI0036C7001E